MGETALSNQSFSKKFEVRVIYGKLLKPLFVVLSRSKSQKSAQKIVALLLPQNHEKLPTYCRCEISTAQTL